MMKFPKFHLLIWLGPWN